MEKRREGEKEIDSGKEGGRRRTRETKIGER